MFEKFKTAIEVLQAGRSLSNPAAWKNGQIAANSGILLVLLSLRTLLPEHYRLSDDTITNAALIIGALGSIANGYLTAATSEKVGFKRRKKKF